MEATSQRSRAAVVVTLVVMVTAALMLLPGCGAGTTAPPTDEESTMTLTVTSTEFDEGATIPERFTCRGEGSFPAIQWSGDLAGAGAVAIVVDDPDAPGGTFTHLVALDLPATPAALSQPFPAGAVLARNSADGAGWTPPCPPSGEHRYRFTVYGLSAPTGLDVSSSPADALAAIEDLEVARGTLTGLVAA